MEAKPTKVVTRLTEDKRRPPGRVLTILKNENMERMMSMGTIGTPIPQRRVPVKEAPETLITMPERGSAGPAGIGKLLEPVQQIMGHPDRDRLMAKLFRNYK